MTKANEYDEDLRGRADRLARAAISGGAPRRERPQTKPRKAYPEAARGGK